MPVSPLSQPSARPDSLRRQAMRRASSSRDGATLPTVQAAAQVMEPRDPRPHPTRILSEPTPEVIVLPRTNSFPFPQTPLLLKKASVLGMRTYFKPLWLLGMGSLGNACYGTGTVAMERGIYPRKPLPQLPGSPLPPPQFQALFDDRIASIGVGATLTGVGLLLAGTASVLFFQDARRLACRQNPQNTSYMKPNIYFAVHLTAISLSVGYKFMVEALRDVVSRDTTWLAAAPGLLGQAAFAVTQAQAFSSCELYNGKMPLMHRSAISFAARFGISLYPLLGALTSIPFFNSYVREIVRLAAQGATTLAFSLPLTTSRIQRHEGVVAAGHHPKPAWHSLQVFALYAAGRFAVGYGPDIIQEVLLRNDDPFSLEKQVAQVFGGSILLTIGTGMCVAALMLFKQDVAAYNAKKSNFLAVMTIGALFAVAVYRGLFEGALTTNSRHLLWSSVVPGIIGNGISLAILPEMLAYSELLHGDLPVRYRYQCVEFARAIGSLSFGLWAAMLSIPKFNSYIRQTFYVVACIGAILGMALPTTTTRRTRARYDFPISPGATPAAELEGFSFELRRRSSGGPSANA